MVADADNYNVFTAGRAYIFHAKQRGLPFCLYFVLKAGITVFDFYATSLISGLLR
jgi:hypothetical protein